MYPPYNGASRIDEVVHFSWQTLSAIVSGQFDNGGDHEDYDRTTWTLHADGRASDHECAIRFDRFHELVAPHDVEICLCGAECCFGDVIPPAPFEYTDNTHSSVA